jgi:UDP-glucuronate 4-epimerase
MALMIFTKAILNNEPINLFNNGNHKRDFTYVDDIVKSILLLLKTYPSQWAPIYNIGNCNPIQLTVLTNLLEKKLEKKGVYNYCPIQRGDIEETCADMTLFENQFGRQEFTPFEKGVDKFLKWYLEYYSEYGNKK